jgi:SAM-dependent methyltransferase
MMCAQSAQQAGQFRMRARAAYDRIRELPFHSVLDIGCGDGVHTKGFRSNDKVVTAVDYEARTNDVIVGDFTSMQRLGPFDLVWLSQVLEHQPNVGLFLARVHEETVEGGWVAVTVPPLKHRIVGGHVSLWNAGLLLYNLVLARFDCSNAMIKSEGYDISVILKKRTICLPQLKHDHGDIKRLAPFLPSIAQEEGFNGQIVSWNW